jgi:hypothetical protein
MAQYTSPQEQYGHLWLAEAARFGYDDDDQDTAACAELAEELEYLEIMALNDDLFDDNYAEWETYIYDNDLPLALEQSCYQGVLLPTDQRALRLASCEEKMLSKLRWFFELCPVHIKAYLALNFYTLVRLDRARRTGDADWKPSTAIAEPEESVFFRPNLLQFRNYGR